MTRAIVFAAAAAVLSACAATAQEQTCPSPPADDTIDFGPRVPIAVATDDGEVALQALIADTPAEQGRGMMYRPEMGDDEAMLFVFDDYRPHYFFMRNTCVSLDIIYLAPDGRIASIGRDAVPFSEMLVPSPGPVSGVLEIRGGRAAELGIEPGDTVLHPHFQPAAADAPDEAAGAEGETGAETPEPADD
jgi:hypothetical protein